MLKIIWNKDDGEKMRLKLLDEFNLILTDDPNEVPKDKVGIILEDTDLNKIRPILEMIAIEQSQLIFQSPDGYLQFSVHEMVYLESYGKDIYVHTTEMSTQIIRQPLYQLEEILKPYHFVRIGKSFLVNIAKIRYIRSSLNKKLDLELVSGTHLEVSRSFVKSFKDALGIQKKETKR
ncbi:MAG: LytTR family transcriptional regulator [Acholeplasmataceae bacterium]|nr:LytTR family transcriptional regulator [Acholeplasmataceae bacterium]